MPRAGGAGTLLEVGVESYRGVIAVCRGGPEVLELVEEPVPEPALGEARVRVLAAGAGLPDLLMREGTYPGGPDPPFTGKIVIVPARRA